MDAAPTDSPPSPLHAVPPIWPGQKRKAPQKKPRRNVVEVNLQDIHTVRGDPHRLTEWTQMAMDLSETYA